jgi:methylenetetrahydrofolate dehydrogenase (NADP+)/methenyltetrahydrofolate cyclohydrolase
MGAEGIHHMPARVLDGATVAAAIRQSVAPRVQQFVDRKGRAPSLGIVLVGSDPASEVYVRNKVRAGGESGLHVDLVRLPETATLDELLAVVDRLNRSDTHDGILVQSPLPAAMGRDAAQRVFDSIDPRKDVDGFHPLNVGLLAQGRAQLAPCTPSGVMVLLEHFGVPIAGARAAVIGRSDIVGRPMATLLTRADATVTICHSRTRDLAAVTAQADIVVAAIGRAGFVRPDFVKPGATVIDVGTNRVTDRTAAVSLVGEDSPRLAEFDRRGSLLVGDVHPRVADVAGAVTPVPGGVGPLTIAMLLRNTVTAALAAS